jgi:hypothetical protein
MAGETQTAEHRAADVILAGFRARGYYGPDPLRDMAEHAAQILASRGMLNVDAGEGAVAAMGDAIKEIERLRAELEAAAADIAMLIQKETDAANAESQ